MSSPQSGTVVTVLSMETASYEGLMAAEMKLANATREEKAATDQRIYATRECNQVKGLKKGMIRIRIVGCT